MKIILTPLAVALLTSGCAVRKQPEIDPAKLASELTSIRSDIKAQALASNKLEERINKIDKLRKLEPEKKK